MKKSKPLEELADFIETNVKKGLKGFEKLISDEEDPRPKGDKKAGPLSYVEAFLKDREVAAVVPSSKYLIRSILKAADLKTARVVVEYGAGEGVLTKAVLEGLAGDAALLALEKNEAFFRELKKIHDPRLRVSHDDVRRIGEIMARCGLGKADVILSGVPFSMLRPRERHEILLETAARLAPGGRFVAYQCTTHLIPLLKDYFRKVDTDFVIRNFPPHFVFAALK